MHVVIALDQETGQGRRGLLLADPVLLEQLETLEGYGARALAAQRAAAGDPDVNSHGSTPKKIGNQRDGIAHLSQLKPYGPAQLYVVGQASGVEQVLNGNPRFFGKSCDKLADSVGIGCVFHAYTVHVREIIAIEA